MELQQLRYFCAVARAGSFTRGAEEEGVSQPALSESIRKLETELGAPLFQRLGRGVRLTAAGVRLLAHAEPVIRGLRNVRQSIAALSGPAPGGRLVVACIPTVLPYLLAPRLREFERRFPDVELELIEEITPRLVEKLQRGEADLGVAGLHARNPELLCGEVLREPLYAALPAGHALAERSAVSLRDLEQERLLLLREGHCLRDDVLHACRKSRLRLREVFEGEHLQTLLVLAASGYGVAIVPAMAVDQATGCACLPLDPRGERRIGYLRLRGQPKIPAMTAFIEWLRQAAGDRRQEGKENSFCPR